MANTGFPRTIVALPVYQDGAAHRTARQFDTILKTWTLDPPNSFGSNWHVAICCTVHVDTGAVADLRLRTSSGEQSNGAVVTGWLQGVIVGWTPVSNIGQRLWLMGQTLSGAGGQGLHIIKAEALLMSAPPLSQRPGPTYPPGYTPPVVGVYPPNYTTGPYA